ncbi:MAG: hypothetical protein HFJ12_03190 [Bacilli bacterium]|nr:hypothetical protein [Bacilli bacterium]
MNFKYWLKKTVNIKTNYLIIIIVAAILIIGGCFSYAVFTVSSESKGALNIVTGNLYSHIESIDLDKDKSITVEPNDSVIITLKLLNVNGIEVKANMYYTASSSTVDVNYLDKMDAPPSRNGDILGTNGSNRDSKEMDIKITNHDASHPVTVTFGSNVGLKNSNLDFPVDKREIVKFNGNPYIMKAYNYNDDNTAGNYCLTGDEDTCEKTECYKDKSANACSFGTVIKYRVNDEEEKVFYVIEDHGDTITLQQRENTINNIEWYAEGNDNTKGPLTVLSKLEEETKKWDNVLDQVYTMGTTTFKDIAFTGCAAYNTCSSNAYTLEERTGKARMITAQEAAALNCTDIQNSCPKWMSNYLYLSTNHGGTVDDNTPINGKYNQNYWTMSSFTTIPGSAMNITNSGILTGANGLTTDVAGARAVIEISK